VPAHRVQAPTGTNLQDWGWVLVDDPATRKAMAALLGIPDDQMQAGLFPVAYTRGTHFRAADRSASESRISWNQWS
jgi:nitroreductase